MRAPPAPHSLVTLLFLFGLFVAVLIGGRLLPHFGSTFGGVTLPVALMIVAGVPAVLAIVLMGFFALIFQPMERVYAMFLDENGEALHVFGSYKYDNAKSGRVGPRQINYAHARLDGTIRTRQIATIGGDRSVDIDSILRMPEWSALREQLHAEFGIRFAPAKTPVSACVLVCRSTVPEVRDPHTVYLVSAEKARTSELFLPGRSGAIHLTGAAEKYLTDHSIIEERRALLLLRSTRFMQDLTMLVCVDLLSARTVWRKML